MVFELPVVLEFALIVSAQGSVLNGTRVNIGEGHPSRPWCIGSSELVQIIHLLSISGIGEIGQKQALGTLWWTNIAMENHHFLWENPL